VLTGLKQQQLEAAGQGRQRLEKIAAGVLPGGKLQERTSNVLQLLNLYGPAFLKEAVQKLDWEAIVHQVVVLERGHAGGSRRDDGHGD
jgi:uncharacterized protein YllA (UPF0747 family)